eukprot:c18735_g1_i2 orf=316-3018(+)
MGLGHNCTSSDVSNAVKPRKKAHRTLGGTLICKMSPNNRSSSETMDKTTTSRPRTPENSQEFVVKSHARFSGLSRYIFGRQITLNKTQFVSGIVAKSKFCTEISECDILKTSEVSIGQGHGTAPLSICALQVVLAVLSGCADNLSQDNARRLLVRLKCSTSRFSTEQNTSCKFSEQTILLNLKWGMECVEKAIEISDGDGKAEQLDLAMPKLNAVLLILQQSKRQTIGDSKSYMLGCAHLYLALVWNFKKNPQRVATHLLEMFISCPGFSRHDFAPELWNHLFHPHFNAIESWYTSKCITLANSIHPSSSSIPKPTTATPKKDQIEPLLHSLRDTDNSVAQLPQPPPNLPRNCSKQQLIHINLLDNVYEEILNESTQQYSRYYLHSLIHYEQARDSKAIGAPQSGSMIAMAQGSPGRTYRSIEVGTNGKQPDSRNGSGSRRRLSNLRDRLAEERAADLQRPPPLTRNRVDAILGGFMGKADRFGEELLEPSNESGQVIEHIDAKNSIETSLKEEQLKTDPDESKKLSKSNKNCSEESLEVQSRKRSGYREAENMQPEENSTDNIEETLFSRQSHKVKPPDEFICVLTRQLYTDPVTLETGYTFERSAVQAWLDNNKTACPVTGQPLNSLTIPMTNLVMKRLVEKWKKDNPEYSKGNGEGDTPNTLSNSSLESVQENTFDLPESLFNFPAQKNALCNVSSFTGHGSLKDSMVVDCNSDNELHGDLITHLTPAGWQLCNEEELSKCEVALLKIAGVWMESKGDPAVDNLLMKSSVIDKMVDILLTSNIKEVLKATVYVTAALIQKHQFARHRIKRIDPELKSIACIAKTKDLPEAALLIHFFNLLPSQMQSLEIIPILIEVVKITDADEKLKLPGPSAPKSIAISMMEKIVTSASNKTNAIH